MSSTAVLRKHSDLAFQLQRSSMIDKVEYQGGRKVKKILALTIGSTLTVLAASASSVSDRLAQCQQIEDAVEKLACFEQVANDVSVEPADANTSTNVPSAPVAPAATQSVDTPREAATENVLAAREKPVARPKPVKTETSNRYDASVKRADYTVAGKLIVELTNGEIWQQTSRGGFRLPPAGSGVRVRKSFSGAWFLKFDHDGRESRMKLKRYGD